MCLGHRPENNTRYIKERREYYARATPDFGNAHHPISTSISLKTKLGKNIKK